MRDTKILQLSRARTFKKKVKMCNKTKRVQLILGLGDRETTTEEAKINQQVTDNDEELQTLIIEYKNTR